MTPKRIVIENSITRDELVPLPPCAVPRIPFAKTPRYRKLDPCGTSSGARFFISPERHTGKNGFFHMEPSALPQIRGGLPSLCPTGQEQDEERRLLQEMEVAWTELAEEAEQRTAKR